jgi:hypothetical protein
MKLTVSWPRFDHFLVRKTGVTTSVGGGADVALAVATGQATFTPAVAPPFTLRLKILVQADHPGLGLTLLVDQEFEVTATAAKPLRWFVVDLDTPAPQALRDVGGLHPLLTSVVAKGSWRVTLDNRTVDVTPTVPTVVPLTGMTADMVDPTAGSSIRLLARTDGVDPQLWTTCTPKACRRAPVSDVLAMLTPQQKSLATDLPGAVTPGSPANAAMSVRRALFMAPGLHALAPAPAAADIRSRFLDHFTPDGAGLPNFIVTRGWEPALVASGRHVALAVPVPAGGSHNGAATGALPGFLTDVHRTLQALGDITPPAGATLGKPRFGLGAHSFGGEAAFAALAAKPGAYSDLILIEPMGIGANLGLLARVPAKVCLVGFWDKAVGVPFRTLKATPGAAGRVRLVPKGYPGDAPEKASMATIVGRSANTTELRNPRSLGHAVAPVHTPPDAWVPRIVTFPPPAKPVSERFAMLHQYCAWGADDEGAGGAEKAFLTQALLGSDLR